MNSLRAGGVPGSQVSPVAMGGRASVIPPFFDIYLRGCYASGMRSRVFTSAHCGRRTGWLQFGVWLGGTLPGGRERILLQRD